MAVKSYPARASVRPSVIIKTNTDNMVGSTSESEKRLMLVGMARGGEPDTVYEINTMTQAKEIFRGGDLLDAIEVALTPNDTDHSGTIYAERVGSATQSSYTNKGLTLTSKAFSTDANNIQASLVKNTLNNTYTLSITFDIDNYSHVYTNLGSIMGIYYTGTQNYVDVTIETDVPKDDKDTDVHTGYATKLILKAGADKSSASVVKEFPLGQGKYNKVNELINSISLIDGFNAVYFFSGNKNIETKYLDAVDSLEISKNSTAPTYLTSLGGDIVNALTTEDDTAVSATYTPIKGEPDAFDITSLTGGTASEIAPASWAKEFENLVTAPAFYLVPLTADETIQAEAMSFCAERNKEADPRALIVGGGINDSASATIQRCNSLRTREARVGVIAVSGSKLMSSGAIVDLPAYIIAAQVGGLASGLPVGESITHKHLDLADIDQKFTKEQLDNLNNRGAIGIEYVRERNDQVFTITNDITTALPISQYPEETELGTGEAVDFLVTALRTELESTFIGSSTSLSAAAELKTAIISFLQQEQNNGLIQDYKESDVHVSVVEEVADIQISCVLARTLKTINVGISFVNEEVIA